jgi:erythromycin esterase
VTEGQVVAALQYHVWRTEEVMDLLRWLRNENARREPSQRIVYFGYDPQDYEYRATGGTMKQIVELTTSADAALGNTIRQQYTAFTLGTDTIVQTLKYTPAQTTRMRAILADIRTRTIAAESMLSARLGQADAAWVLRSVVVVEQNWTKAEFDLGGQQDKSYSFRDSSMAANARWWQQRLGSGAKVALWAHNGHVSNTSLEGYTAMGRYLTNDVGSQYRVLGFALGGGQYNGNTPSDPQQIPTAASGTVDATLGLVGIGSAFYDLRLLSGAARTWSTSARGLRWLGAGDRSGPLKLVDVALSPTFDAVLYVNLTTPSRKLSP